MGIMKLWKGLLKGKKAPKAKKKPAIKARKKALRKPAPKPKEEKPRVSKRKVSKPKEKPIGIITHYFGKISVGIIKLKSTLKVGDSIQIKGAHSDFFQVVTSMQANHKDITRAVKGAEIGIKVSQRVHENDRVYRYQVPFTNT